MTTATTGTAVRVIETPVGRLTVIAGPTGIRGVLWDHELAGEVPVGGDPAASAHVDAACAQLGEYFAGERQEFDVILDPVGTPFQRAAWVALAALPKPALATWCLPGG